MDLTALVPLFTALFISLVALGISCWFLRVGALRDGRVLSCYASIFVPSLALTLGVGHLSLDMYAHSTYEHRVICPLTVVLGMMLFIGSLFVGGYLWRQQRVGGLATLCNPASPAVQDTANRLAQGFGIAVPPVLVIPTQQPVAFALGIQKARIYLSPGLLEILDAVELEQVIAHELAHIQRRDNLIALVSVFFLGATAYLPSSWWAFGYLLRERELAADELAVSVTDKPVALARALLKVAVPGHPAFSPAAGLIQPDTVDLRVKNLVRLHYLKPRPQRKGNQEKLWLLALTLLSPLPVGWLIFELPHLLHLP
ncbi:M56 family metallopeptidase [Candidatus Cyanaurora vandensis]|uniref:M56 family metallopeptidase n=1 Tax=Candidatus Cyanaurora vandensis TaxID=2714958 RepID=UPI00257DBA19|nr:M56 family metallopeptidase [Candidatus Cyanaurora vandensis]